MAQPGSAHAALEFLGTAVGRLAVDQQAQPFGVAEIGRLVLALQLGEGLGHLGRIEEARPVLEQLLRRKPDFSAASVRRFVFYNKRPEDLERYIEGLRRAGLAD